MAAMMTRAEPSIALATGLDGSRSWLAIWAADRPASTCGLYWAPARMSWLAMSRNGTDPDWSAVLNVGGPVVGADEPGVQRGLGLQGSADIVSQLGGAQREVGAGVAGGAEGERGGVRVEVGGRGRGGAEVAPGAEVGQRDDQWPALGCAER
jgi:hypothetical protein